ncbi:oxidoreductase [Zhengella mangrovi]|uniref:Oxidoreductase n=1 Tax=Zhengella mangrovi TaxID=1982044 RepID=A0A2G1QQD1_9HYPH|nr:SDR family oxidoreductase [Zhengella mangrovi]PHP67767.1 oxidoreductase [Zhengella mangrovi]
MTVDPGTETKKVAFVSGGGTGVGAATARHLARRGCRVAINYRRSGEAAEEVVAACRAEGGEVMALQGDVASDADCRSMVARVVETWGGLDILVCSAGTTQFTTMTDLDAQNAEDFQRVYATNVIGVHQLARAAAPHLERSGAGAIVTISSIAGVNGNGSSLAYVASKGALNSLTLALARLLAPKVRVNAVLPGLIESGWFLNGMDADKYEAIRDNFAAASALGSVCSPDDIADAAVFLALDGRKMTGQFVTVDAGYLLGRAVRVSR